MPPVPFLTYIDPFAAWVVRFPVLTAHTLPELCPTMEHNTLKYGTLMISHRHVSHGIHSWAVRRGMLYFLWGQSLTYLTFGIIDLYEDFGARSRGPSQ